MEQQSGEGKLDQGNIEGGTVTGRTPADMPNPASEPHTLSKAAATAIMSDPAPHSDMQVMPTPQKARQRKIVTGLKDAVAYAKGDKSKASRVTVMATKPKKDVKKSKKAAPMPPKKAKAKPVAKKKKVTKKKVVKKKKAKKRHRL